jgi:hypothetical protein
MVMPDLGDRTWAYSQSASIPISERFAYRVEKTQGLPYLRLLFFGDKKNNLAVIDSNGVSHAIRFLSSGESWLPHNAFAYCPTKACTISGVADRSKLVLMEPKEIGTLSLGAMLAGQSAYHVFGVGVTLLLLLFMSLILNIKGNMRHTG